MSSRKSDTYVWIHHTDQVPGHWVGPGDDLPDEDTIVRPKRGRPAKATEPATDDE